MATHSNAQVSEQLVADTPLPVFHAPALRRAYARLDEGIRSHWLWWKLPIPPSRKRSLRDIVDIGSSTSRWLPEAETNRLVEMTAGRSRERIVAMGESQDVAVAAGYRRTRLNAQGQRVQRLEIRCDGLAGCLRTPSGGSSRQMLLVAQHGDIRARWMTPRETARLMGLPEEYLLPENDYEAYRLTGDGVAVPVVHHLAKHLLHPLCQPLDHARSERSDRTP